MQNERKRSETMVANSKRPLEAIHYDQVLRKSLAFCFQHVHIDLRIPYLKFGKRIIFYLN